MIDFTNEPLNIANFCGYYAFNPTADQLSEADKIIASIATAILAVSTLGLFHLTCYLFFFQSRDISQTTTTPLPPSIKQSMDDQLKDASQSIKPLDPNVNSESLEPSRTEEGAYLGYQMKIHEDLLKVSQNLVTVEEEFNKISLDFEKEKQISKNIDKFNLLFLKTYSEMDYLRDHVIYRLKSVYQQFLNNSKPSIDDKARGEVLKQLNSNNIDVSQFLTRAEDLNLKNNQLLNKLNDLYYLISTVLCQKGADCSVDQLNFRREIENNYHRIKPYIQNQQKEIDKLKIECLNINLGLQNRTSFYYEKISKTIDLKIKNSFTVGLNKIKVDFSRGSGEFSKTVHQSNEDWKKEAGKIYEEGHKKRESQYQERIDKVKKEFEDRMNELENSVNP